MISKSLVAASSKPLILTILSWEENYGYEIIQKVGELSGGVLEWSDGMLYPVLYKLEKDGLVQSRWEVQEGARPRKYYSITKKGKEELAHEKAQWINVNDVLQTVWKMKPSVS